MTTLLQRVVLLTLSLFAVVNIAQARIPTITTHPTHDTNCARTTAVFRVVATDSPTHYTWLTAMSDTASIWDTVRVGGLYATNMRGDSLRVFAADTLSGRWYRVACGNDSGTVTSNPARLTVIPVLSAGTITGSTNRVCYTSGTIMVSTTGSAGGTWWLTDTTIATISTSWEITARHPGVDTLYYTVSNSCGTSRSWFAFTIDSTASSSPIMGPNAVCLGSTITLSHAMTGGTWSTLTGNASISSGGVVSGVHTGLDTAVYNFSNACGSFTRTLPIRIDSTLPSVTISGTRVICTGSWTSFSTSVSGGVWLSSSSSVAVVDASGNVTGRSTGMALISYMISNACGASTAQDTVWVQAPAATVMGRDSIGVMDSTIYTNTVPGGRWWTSDTAIATINTMGKLFARTAGTVNVSYQVINACGTTVQYKTVRVGTAPAVMAIMGRDTVCLGSTINLTDSTNGGVWSITNASCTITPGGQVRGVIYGMLDTVYYTVTSGFGSNSAMKVIYVERSPVVTVDTLPAINLGTAYTLVAHPSGGTWVSTQPTKVTFISANTFVALRRVNTDLIYTVTNICGTGRDTFTVKFPAGLNSVSGNATLLPIMPNPSTGSFSMAIPAGTERETKVTITNAVGQVVYEKMAATNATHYCTINVPAGIYFVAAQNGTETYTATIAIEK